MSIFELPPKCEYCNQPIIDVRKHYSECRLAHMNAVIKKKNKNKKKNTW
jgi:hypothetical protein